jgi:hypothetical protein
MMTPIFCKGTRLEAGCSETRDRDKDQAIREMAAPFNCATLVTASLSSLALEARDRTGRLQSLLRFSCPLGTSVGYSTFACVADWSDNGAS